MNFEANQLQTTLDDLKRRLREERVESETLTQHLTAQREQNRLAEDGRRRKLESELADALRQLADQRQCAESLRQQMARQQLDMRARAQQWEQDLAEAQERWHAEHMEVDRLAADRDSALAKANQHYAETLQQELTLVRAQLDQQRQSSDAEEQRLAIEREQHGRRVTELEGRASSLDRENTALRAEVEACRASIAVVTAERDESRAELNEVQSRAHALQEEFAATHAQFREQREAAVHVIEQLERDCEDNRMRSSELEARTQWLEEELTSAREKLRSVPLTLMLLSTDLLAGQFQADPVMVEAVRDIEMQSQKLLAEIRPAQLKAEGAAL